MCHYFALLCRERPRCSFQWDFSHKFTQSDQQAEPTESSASTSTPTSTSLSPLTWAATALPTLPKRFEHGPTASLWGKNHLAICRLLWMRRKPRAEMLRLWLNLFSIINFKISNYFLINILKIIILLIRKVFQCIIYFHKIKYYVINVIEFIE